MEKRQVVAATAQAPTALVGVMVQTAASWGFSARGQAAGRLRTRAKQAGGRSARRFVTRDPPALGDSLVSRRGTSAGLWGGARGSPPPPEPGALTPDLSPIFVLLESSRILCQYTFTLALATVMTV
jgi:hypothetical protein